MTASTPDSVSAELRRIADRIDASKSPSVQLVAQALKSVLATMQDEQLEDFWVTREEVAAVCPPCAETMKELRIREVRASAIFGADMLALATEHTAKGWKGLPRGWTEESARKFWKSVGGKEHLCAEKMKGKVSDPDAFCASLKDKIKKTTHWRGPEK